MPREWGGTTASRPSAHPRARIFHAAFPHPRSQDDYDSWVGEGALVRWGEDAGRDANEGWIRYNRHGRTANYVFQDGHAAALTWSAARTEHYPDRRVRQPLDNPPN